MTDQVPKPIRPKRVPTPKWSVTHQVRFIYAGSFFNEESAVVLDEPTVEAALAKFPPDAFAFDLFDLKEADVWVEDDLVRVGKTIPYPGRYYVGGSVYDHQQIFDLAKANPEVSPSCYPIWNRVAVRS